ncbi:MAG: hypothetical protein QOE70_6870 [Chthoniobacter sp.]|jgi:hypothetical protein|nr:hypothetical protein [Chthoniobacter sp.]
MEEEFQGLLRGDATSGEDFVKLSASQGAACAPPPGEFWSVWDGPSGVGGSAAGRTPLLGMLASIAFAWWEPCRHCHYHVLKPLRLISCQTIWCLAFAAFVAVGTRGIWRPGGGFPLKSCGRQGSVDSILEKTLGRPDLEPALSAEIGRLPSGDALLILAPPGKASAGLVAEVVAYLAWPRPVTLVIEPVHLSAASLLPMRERFAAVVLCEVPAPDSFPAGHAFGPALTLIPLTPQ